MTDSTNEPERAEKKPARHWIWWTAGIVVVAIVVLGMIPIYGEAATMHIRTRNLAEAGGIFPALKMYAQDHDGQYPRMLAELVPEYITLPHVPWYLDDSDAQFHRRFEWFYVPGVREISPGDWIVLASPTYDLAGKPKRHARIVVYNSGARKIIPAEDFHAALAAQLKAMAAQTSAPP